MVKMICHSRIVRGNIKEYAKHCMSGQLLVAELFRTVIKAWQRLFDPQSCLSRSNPGPLWRECRRHHILNPTLTNYKTGLLQKPKHTEIMYSILAFFHSFFLCIVTQPVLISGALLFLLFKVQPCQLFQNNLAWFYLFFY